MNQETEPHLFTISQKAIIRDKKNRILMMEKAGKGHWDLPGGKLDADERMVKGLEREVEEEIGTKGLKVGRIIHAGRRRFPDEPGKHDRIMIFYDCEIDLEFDKIKLSDEHTDWRLMDKSDLSNEKKYEINPVVRHALKIAISDTKGRP